MAPGKAGLIQRDLYYWSLVIVDQAFVSATNFICLICIARTLPASEFAIYTLVFTVCLFFTALLRAVITLPIELRGPVEPRRSFEVRVAASINLIALTSLPLFIAAVVLSRNFPAKIAPVVGPFFYIIFWCIHDLFRRRAYVLKAPGAAFGLDVVAYGIPLTLIVVAYRLKIDIDASLTFWILSAGFAVALMSLGMARVIRSRFLFRKKSNLMGLFRENLAHTKWVLLSQLVFFGGTQIYGFVLLRHAGREEVAAYGAAMSIINIFNVLRLIVQTGAQTKAAMIYSENGLVAMGGFLYRIAVASSVVSVLVACALGFWADYWIYLIFAGKYQEAASILPLLAVVQVISAIGVVMSVACNVLNKNSGTFWGYLIAAIFSLTAGVWLVDQYKLMGAALALAVSTVIPVLVQAKRLLKDILVLNAGGSFKAG